ncbi:protein RRP [Salix suchowensis]|nr:protein RRP [Salix suchowensis]
MAAPSKKKQQNPKQNDGPKFNKASQKQFKAKQTKIKKSFSNDAVVKDASIAFQLEDDVPDFPRGGKSSLSQREREEIRAEVDEEFEGEERYLNKKNKKGKKFQNKSSQLSADDLGSLFGDGITGKLPRFANKITMKNISPGMKLLGVVAEVNEKDLVIGLPGGLRGLVRSMDAVDPFLNDQTEPSKSIPCRQLVSCIVLQMDDDKNDNKKRKIWLSLRLSLLHSGFSLDAVKEGMVLTAYVKSIEDHGFILHFGLSSFMGFLPKISKAESRDSEVKTGQFLQGVVTRIDKTRKVVYLSSDPDTVSKCVTKDLKGISIDLLIPGMMVDARVQSTLENGIMLSFLTYFTGTVDMFHLQNTFPTSNWKVDYAKNKKVNARILFIDPSTRAVGLTLNQHLVHNSSPPSCVKVGDIHDNAKVVRVDRGMGLLLEIPSTPLPTPTFVNVSDVAEDEVRKLENKFKEGSSVRVRILGYRHLEGLATGILKDLFHPSDVKPGMVTRAKIIAVDSFGAIVQFPGGVKALCPLRHMSEFEIVKPRKKFKVGAELFFRVLGCKSKRITVTHKKTLIEKPGCFVHFYNGVQGFAPRSELGLEPGSDAISMYQVGQVVKCRVTSSIAASHRINLSFIMKPLRFSEEDGIKMGSVVTGVIDKVTPSLVTVYVNAKDYMKGTIATEHLTDHHEHAALMKSVLKPGYKFDQLLVLDIESNNLVLTAKYSLIKSASQLPSDLSQIHPQSIVHGYICNLIETGCFVRFLGNLTAFSPRSKAMDDQRSQLSEAFYIGQSVRSNIIDVNNETSRITVSLKQSCCSSTDASFLQEYFLSENKIADLQSSDSKGRDLKWVEGFNIGSTVEGKIQESKEFGVVVSFEKHNDVFGFITHHQLGGAMVEAGAIVRAAVLDVAKTERLVDLSLKLEFLDKSRDKSFNSLTHKKKRKGEMSKDLEVHQTVNAVVEIVKENYLVLSIPEHNYAIGYASVTDYNTQKISQKQFQIGQSVSATVMALPIPSTAGRLLLLLKSISEVTETSSSKKAKRKSSYNVGSLIQAEITEIKPLEMRLKFGIGFRGRIHITENPLSNFRVGQTVSARIIAKAGRSDNKKSQMWDLSIKPKMLEDSCMIEDKLVPEQYEFSSGQCVSGYVYKVDGDWAWLTISRHLKAKLFVLDSACEPSELQEFEKRFYVGKAVTGHVLNYNKEKASLRLVLHPFAASQTLVDGGAPIMDDLQSNDPWDNVTAHIRKGAVVGGRISKILPGVGGLLVQLGPHIHGRVHFTELQESLVPDPLSAYKEGQFVKSKVLEISHPVKGTIHIDLSLHLSLNGMLHQNSAEYSNNQDAPSKRVDKIEDLQRGMVVQVRDRMFHFTFRNLDAKILISNLSDGFIDDPVKEFPIGKLVTGRVLSVEHLSKRIEVTLKSSTSNGSKSENSDLSHLHVGEIISGRIKRVESYGLFIVIDHTNLVGLCHMSQLLDDHIGNIESKYRAGEKVTAKILKVDEERRRISLGMKNLDVQDELDSSKEESDEEMTESRTSIPPLEVTLDDMEHSDPVDVLFQNQGHLDEADTMVNKKKQEKKKSKKLSEQEITAAEDRRLEGDEPRTADEFEMVIRSSPNNSFLWIAYMRFMLSLADIEKARSIAERALNTINFREEDEKLNIWDAVKKVFQRALQYCDPKKVHLFWLKRVKWLLKQKQDGVQSVVQRALLCLPRHKHIKFISQTAIREFKCGVADRGRTLFEEILREYPKRTDLWSVYLDQEIKLGDVDVIRALFERAISLSLPPKKMKFLFKKYLEFEKPLGDEKQIESVKQKAMEYVRIPWPD